MGVLSGGILICRGSLGGFLLRGRISYAFAIGTPWVWLFFFRQLSAAALPGAPGFGGGRGGGRGGGFGMGGFGGLGIINLAAMDPVLGEIGLEGVAADKMKKLAEEVFPGPHAEGAIAGIGSGAFGQLQDLCVRRT